MFKKVSGLLEHVGLKKSNKEENKTAAAKIAQHKRICSMAQSTASSSD